MPQTSGNNEIVYYEKVADLYNALGIPVEQDISFTIDSLLDFHRSFPFKSPVFRTNYYSFIFVKEGAGNYTTDDQTFSYENRTIYFTNPGHLKAFEFHHLAEAYLITLSETFLKETVHQDIFEEFPFLLAETVAPQTLSPAAYLEIERIYLQILDEYQRESKYKLRIIGNLFVVLLLKIKETFWKDYYPILEGDSQSKIVKKFKEDLESHYAKLAEGEADSLFQAQDYAKAQHLHPNYFSQVIKSKTGKTVSHWMAEKSITQGKAYLKHSSLPIKEIAYRLGFAETAHFSNFFKKHTGTSPSTYRKLA